MNESAFTCVKLILSIILSVKITESDRMNLDWEIENRDAMHIKYERKNGRNGSVELSSAKNPNDVDVRWLIAHHLLQEDLYSIFPLHQWIMWILNLVTKTCGFLSDLPSFPPFHANHVIRNISMSICNPIISTTSLFFEKCYPLSCSFSPMAPSNCQ